LWDGAKRHLDSEPLQKAMTWSWGVIDGSWHEL
jgi:hypothetical protein